MKRERQGESGQRTNRPSSGVAAPKPEATPLSASRMPPAKKIHRADGEVEFAAIVSNHARGEMPNCEMIERLFFKPRD